MVRIFGFPENPVARIYCVAKGTSVEESPTDIVYTQTGRQKRYAATFIFEYRGPSCQVMRARISLVRLQTVSRVHLGGLELLRRI